MKIFAQSTLASGSPYIHLGYGAATAREIHRTLSTGGLMSLGVGMAIVGAVIAGKAAAGVAAFKPLRRHWIVLLLGGCACMILGGISLYMSPVNVREYYVDPEGATIFRSMNILDAIEVLRIRNQAVPEDLSSLDLPPKTLEDGWMSPFRLVIEGEKGSQAYTILSAGPDGKFGTADDVSDSLQPIWKEKESGAAALLKRLATLAINQAAAEDNLLVARIELVRSDNKWPVHFNDPRLTEPSAGPARGAGRSAITTQPARGAGRNTATAQADPHCDYYYTGTGVRLNEVPHPSSFILLYDHPGAGPNRLVAFADSHVEKLPANSSQLERFVGDSNGQRTELKLPPLPVGLSGPPPAVP